MAYAIDYGKPRGFLAHPLTSFLAVWIMVTLLYMWHLSGLLRFDNNVLLPAISYIVFPFIFAILAGWFLFSVPRRSGAVPISPETIEKLEKRLKTWLIIWSIISVFEIAYSGGMPILWLLRGSSKNYFDFGIHSLHGLANSLLLAIGLCNFALYMITRKKKYLRIPVFIFIWSIMAVTRNMMMVFSIEATILWELFQGFRRRTLVVGLAAFMGLILLFGYVGDMRTGADKFRNLAEPAAEYPDWLPSGVLWVYVYMTTPINNLINTAVTVRPGYNLLFPNTTCQLFPTVLRAPIYGAQFQDDARTGNLVTEAFNVSTAYVGAYQDWGYLGVGLFSVALAGLAIYFWNAYSLRGMLTYAVIGQCLVLSVFYNHLFYLPIITQVMWLYIFCDGRIGRAASHVTRVVRRKKPLPTDGPVGTLAPDAGGGAL